MMLFVVVKATTYRISVRTSGESGAGTDAKVFVVLFGEHGDSGEIHLKDSETNKDPFETNQTDVFTVANVLDLGRLVKLRVWHDNKGNSIYFIFISVFCYFFIYLLTYPSTHPLTYLRNALTH